MPGYRIIEIIGDGAYGAVLKGQNKRTGEIVSMKKVKFVKREGVPVSTLRLISLINHLDHPNILKIENIVVDEETKAQMFIMFEYMPTDLRTYLESFGSGMLMEPHTVQSFLWQINSALWQCHLRGIQHRNLKPQNLLLDKRTGVIKVADFSDSQACLVPRTYSQEVAALWYRAPELLLGDTQYCCSIDMWSVGCVFAEMVSGRPLFPGDSEMDQLFRIFRILKTPTEQTWPGVTSLPHYKLIFPKWTTSTLHTFVQNLSLPGMDLLQKMLVYDPQRRIIGKDVLEHPYFNGVQLPAGLSSVSPP